MEVVIDFLYPDSSDDAISNAPLARLGLYRAYRQSFLKFLLGLFSNVLPHLFLVGLDTKFVINGVETQCLKNI